MSKIMKKSLHLFIAALSFILATGPCWAQAGKDAPASCRICGMELHKYAHSRILIQFDEEGSIGACSIHCAAMELALNRRKDIRVIHAADYRTKKFIAAKSAFWVIGGSRPGVMTARAKWAFEKQSDAEAFTKKYGGRISDFDEAMKATFQDMDADIKLIRQRRVSQSNAGRDIKDHPECRYCGMKRDLFASSRMLIKYGGGPAVGTCSIHCASIDLALNTDKVPEAILVGDYKTRRLTDAERAFWVIGGTKAGVMSIRGKWAFENRKDADAFMQNNGGRISTFDDAMKATFEDMDEILK